MRVLGPVGSDPVGPVFDVRHDWLPGCSMRKRSLSVIIRFGAIPCVLQKAVSNRLAALVSRRFWTIFRQAMPVLIDGPHSQCFLPAM